jgi:hypothetical protein
MKHRFTFGSLIALAVVTLNSVVLLVPSPALAAGATQIAGLGFFAAAGACVDPPGPNAGVALTLTGDLDGCWYYFPETQRCLPNGIFLERGTVTFVGQYNGQDGTFRATFHFTAKFEDCVNGVEIFGQGHLRLLRAAAPGCLRASPGSLSSMTTSQRGTSPIEVISGGPQTRGGHLNSPRRHGYLSRVVGGVACLDGYPQSRADNRPLRSNVRSDDVAREHRCLGNEVRIDGSPMLVA